MIVPQTLDQTPTPSNSMPQDPASYTSSLAMIFLTAASMNHLPYSHLPTLTSLASATRPHALQIRLVQLGVVAEIKLCEALGIPRVGVIGVLEGAPGAIPLIEYVRGTVEAVDVPWTREVGAGKWLGTKILDGEEAREKPG